MGTIRSAISEIRSEAASLPTDRRTLRRFGLLIGFVLIGFAGVWAWRSSGALDWKIWIPLGAGIPLFGLAWALPTALRGVYRIWMLLAVLLGFVMTRVLLTTVYFLVVTPTGLIMRLLGHDPMNRRPDASLDTYWLPRDASANDRERMERYF